MSFWHPKGYSHFGGFLWGKARGVGHKWAHFALADSLARGGRVGTKMGVPESTGKLAQPAENKSKSFVLNHQDAFC